MPRAHACPPRLRARPMPTPAISPATTAPPHARARLPASSVLPLALLRRAVPPAALPPAGPSPDAFRHTLLALPPATPCPRPALPPAAPPVARAPGRRPRPAPGRAALTPAGPAPRPLPFPVRALPPAAPHGPPALTPSVPDPARSRRRPPLPRRPSGFGNLAVQGRFCQNFL
ncbi:lysine-rich arabinogalactan protein 19-like [Miscanthus floridulus]|uniref:lysine-rich arabinogalactan protein 19-like n=1 Tax=Miscanthus floridulus TaxID=154761 RepID=UPI00345ADE9A